MVEISGPEALAEKVVDQLKMVYDPEIPVNIYDLGLIYKVAVDEADECDVTMTFTSPACPIAGEILNEVNERVSSVDGINDCRIHISWNPPWNKSMASERAQIELSQIFGDF